MFELDKQQFGAFVADQRRQKQMTRKRSGAEAHDFR